MIVQPNQGCGRPTTWSELIWSLRRQLRLASVVLVGALLVSASSAAQAPTGRTSFRSYGPDDGLSNLVTRYLVEDRLHFVWVGTDDGLFRFDGERFVRFGIEAGLPSTRVSGLHAAPDGRLWMASRGSLAYLPAGRADRPLPQRFVTIPAEHGPRGVISSLATPPSPDGSAARLYVGTNEGLFVETDAGSARFALVDKLPPGEVTALHVEADGTLYIGRGARLWALRADGTLLDEAALTGGGRRAAGGADRADRIDRIDRIARDRLGRLWLRSPSGLWMQAKTGGAFIDRSSLLPAISTNGYLALDRAGDIWALTNRGLVHVDGERSERLPPGLPTDWSWSFVEDHEGSRFIGSTGLHRELGRGLFRSFGMAEGFGSEIFWELRRDRDGSLLAATDEGLARLGPRGVERIAGTEHYTIRSVVLAPDGSYFAAGSPAEILHLLPQPASSGAAPSYRVEKIGATAGLRGKTVMALLLDEKGQLYIGTDTAGLQRMAIAGPRSITPVPLADGSPSELINDLRQDARGRLFVAGERGLAIVDGSQVRRLGTKEGLLGRGTNTLLLRRSGEICVSYFDSLGLSCFVEVEGTLTKLRHFDRERGLHSSRVYSIGEDAAGRLWVGTGAGVDVLSGERFEHFGKSDGLPGDDCDSRSFLADADGGVWIGTSTGLGYFAGARYTGPPSPPSVSVVEAWAGARSLEGDRLVLRADERTLSVGLASTSHAHERRVTFETRLLGFDEWHAGASRELRYAGLSPGSYRLDARARIDSDVFGPLLSIPVLVEPAWFQTWWARALLGLGATGFVGLLIGWRVRRLRQRNVELQGIVDERTAELKVANQALTDLSLTDPLTGLRNRRFLSSTIPTDVAQVQRTYRDLSSGRTDRMPRNVDLVFLLVDLDHFKQVNDVHGHGAGDRVLQDLRAILMAACRTSDIVVRWGGEEFLLVARNSSREEAPILAERVRASIEAHAFDIGGPEPLYRTCSVGFAAFPFIPQQPDLASWEDVIDLADRCLYLAKREGRNRWVGVRATRELALPAVESGERPRLHQQFDRLIVEGALELLRSGDPSSK